jgi:hypothetical protein
LYSSEKPQSRHQKLRPNVYHYLRRQALRKHSKSQ